MREMKRARLYSKRFDKFCKSIQKKLKKSEQLYKICAGWTQKPQELETFRIYFFGFETLYRVLFVLFSFAALVHSGYWYCGCLLYVFLKSKLLAQVVVALYRSGEALSQKLKLLCECTLIVLMQLLCIVAQQLISS